jgi:hypothetical protein
MTSFFSRELEELEAIREAEETALAQAEVAAQEAAAGMFGNDDDDDALDDLSNSDDEHIATPSTRSLSRDDKKSPDDLQDEFVKSLGRGSFKDPTQPLSASIRRPPMNEEDGDVLGKHSTLDGMTHSAIQRHVRNM